MSSRRPVQGLTRWARLARLGLSGAGTALTGQDPTALAERAATQLADLRGLAAKAGQLGSYLDAVLPKEAPPGVREALQRLNASTTTSPWEDIEATIRADVPASADALLDALDRPPVASGSIAQVHRATHPEVGPVAVKVQHPGVAEVLRSELSQAGLVIRVAGAVMPGASDTYDEIRDRFYDELDQRVEARRTRAYQQAMADLDGVTVPTVVDAWSGDRVLTTTWCDGLDLDTARTHLPEPVRARAAHHLLSTFGQGIAHSQVHGDPNAGNFRFTEQGDVVVLDLGCVQPVPAEARRSLLDALRSADPEALAHVLGQPTTGPLRDPVLALTTGLLAPWSVQGRIDKAMLHRIGAATPQFKAAVARQRGTAGPPWMPLILRTWIGLLAHAHHLDAPIDGPALRAALPEPV